MNLSVFPQAGGRLGVQQTLDHMTRLTRAAMLDPLIRTQAVTATSGCERGDTRCTCSALLAWVSRSIRYVPDPDGVESLTDPRLMAEEIRRGHHPFGDCDDFSMYLAALLKAIGRQPWFRAVGYDGNPFQHVYVRCDGLPLDATRDAWTITVRPHRETIILDYKV